MAQENIVIDLTDENLIIHPDIYVDTATLDAYGTLVLTRTDGGVISTDLAPLLTDVLVDVYVAGATYVAQTNQLLLHYSDGRADVSVDLSEMIFREYGGTNYDPSKTDYPVGHIVSIPDGSVYVAMINPQNAQPGNDPAQWKLITSVPEKGGILYDGLTTYEIGDIVAVGGKGYINQLSSVGVAPIAGGNANWIDMSLSEYYAGEHTPSAGNEYPNVSGHTPGAYWIISGLITPYTMTGGDLIGKEIENGDKFLWNGSTWLLFPAPHTIEYGGVNHSSNFLYEKGTIVGYGPDAIPYVCILDVTLTDGSQTPTNPIYWKAIGDFEKGGILWGVGTNYVIGDMVSEGNSSYIAIQNNVNQQPSISPGQWISTAGEDSVERGGISWLSATTYLVGDVVSEGTQIYMRINAAGSGATPPSLTPVFWKLLDTAPAKAGLWQNDITYFEGDFVSWGDNIYIAPPAGVAPGVQPPSAPWTLATPEEYRGRVWDTTLAYTVGDAVTVDNSIYIAKTDNVGSNPASQPSADWFHANEIAVEQGGLLWNISTAYDLGSLVTDDLDGSQYIAIASNTGTQPSTNPTEWKKITTNLLYDGTIPYYEGDAVEYDGNIYIAPPGGLPVGTLPTNPATPGEWVLINGDDKGGRAWDSTWYYSIGDLVVDLTDEKIYRSTGSSNV